MTTDSTLKPFPSFPGRLAFAAATAAGAVAGAPAVPKRDAHRRPTEAREYGLALLCVGIVVTIRALLHPILGTASPLLIFVLPTVVMVMRNAPGPALCATVASIAAGLLLFIRPTDPLWWSHPAQLARLGLFVAENLTIVAVGVMLQRYRQRQLALALQAEQLRVVKVTMRTVHDVVNNSLNQLQGLRFEAEGHVPPESIAVFDATIRDTFAKLAALGDLRTYGEKPMEIGVGLDDTLA
jgi:K+-sensing histidine kinase KdpD